MKIISASRRTDIPAFYGDWLINRVRAGFAGCVNPFNNKRYIVSLKKDNVTSFVLWSKNFTPFMPGIELLRGWGYGLFFNFTITGLPGIFEPSTPDVDEAVESLRILSRMFSPQHINWRYDPVLVTDITDLDYHLLNFARLCGQLSGFVERCYISFPTLYGKVRRSFNNFAGDTGHALTPLSENEKISLAVKLSEIGLCHNIAIFSCCGDYLVGDTIEKGHCIDGELILSLDGVRALSSAPVKFKPSPSRKGCGCFQSTDIGIYNSCPHGCIYCYANRGSDPAANFYKKYMSDPCYSESAFLGVSKELSDKWLQKIKEEEFNAMRDIDGQQTLF